MKFKKIIKCDNLYYHRSDMNIHTFYGFQGRRMDGAIGAITLGVDGGKYINK